MFAESETRKVADHTIVDAVRERVAIGRRDLLAAGAGAVAAAIGATSQAQAQAQSAAPSGQQAPSSRSVNQKGLKIEKQGNVLLIGINRPEAQNRIDFPTYIGLGQAYYDYEQDDSLRAAVLYGVGADFSRGLDPVSWAKAFASPLPRGNEFLDPLSVTGADRSKPVVVAVQGQVTRIAHELFLASDVRVAASDTRFNQGEVFGGVFPGGGGTIRFVREAGWANAMRYMLTGEDWGAEEARRFGLVQDVTEPGKQVDRAIELAKRIALGAPLGVKATLTSAHRALSEGEKAAFAALPPEFGKMLRSEDRQEFLRATQENRAPVSSDDDMSVVATRPVADLLARAGGVALGLCVTMLFLAAVSVAKAAELQIFCANGLKSIVANLAGQFETTSDDKARVSYDEATILLRRLQAGERSDVIILTRSVLEELAKSAQVVPDTLTTLASADALGIVVRSGGTARDTTTAAGFKDWLLAVKSIAVTDPAIGGLAAQQFFRVIDQLGIAEQLKPKLILAKGAGVSNARLITSGEAEAAVQLAYLLRPADGIELVAVPKQLQLTVTFAAAVATGSGEPDRARAFVDFLASPAAAPAIETAGMHPGSS